MRRALPWVGQVCALLLLLQWGIGAGACLAALRFDPAQVVCHVPAEDGSAPAMPGGACALCAPLPPGVVPAPGVVAAPVAVPVGPVMVVAVAAWVLPEPRCTPQQPRAPPFGA